MCYFLLHQKARWKPDMITSEFVDWAVSKTCSSSYSERNAGEKWKSDEVMEVRTGRLVNDQPPGLFAEHTDRFIVDDDDMGSNTVEESGMSWKSSSFLHRLNCERFWTNLQKMQHKTAANILFNVVLRQFAFHQRHREQSHIATDVRHIWEIDNRTIRRDLWNK